MWVIAGALIVWSAAMWLADRQQNLTKGMQDVSIKDALVIDCFLVNCQWLIVMPGT